MSLNKKRIIISSLILIIVVIPLGMFFYIKNITSSRFDIDKTVYIKIDENKDYESLKDQLKNVAHINSIGNFEKVASFLDYPKNIKTGRYAIKPQMTVLEVVRLLKSGQQAPVKLTFNNIRTKDDLAMRLSEQLMISKQELDDALNNDEVCKGYGFTPQTIVSMFIPNTYEVYWNTSMDKFLNRMKNEYDKFWNESRVEKAKSLNLSQTEVSTLASIVEEECYFSDEYPIVAGLYLNRLRKGMLLQADPTVKYAVGDFTLRRVLNKHLAEDSPYNTYKYAGLPPGPIRIPSIKAIDAVLNYKKHDYLYMCAKEDFSSRHNFAVTHAEHARNAQKYQAALNQRRIYQ